MLQGLVNFDMLTTFSFVVSSNLSQQKSPTAETRYRHNFSVGQFCCDKFEETPNEKVVNMSKLTKLYFSELYQFKLIFFFAHFVN